MTVIEAHGDAAFHGSMDAWKCWGNEWRQPATGHDRWSLPPCHRLTVRGKTWGSRASPLLT
ncbi:hypothetical protein BC629DRAFT_313019 [Irpex lacteus]|nr:hypothetical protein BC629DRAFT_313019 [Irpex lacteus]